MYGNPPVFLKELNMAIKIIYSSIGNHISSIKTTHRDGCTKVNSPKTGVYRCLFLTNSAHILREVHT
jgi:hypothetical protein